ncbi:MAG: precorrin-6y C5,15-methyltransferase (decarboxylating) subunit CbiE [Nitrospirales bacterium]|nr:precorrin-6y C5,15-methyltransferase (decarboxylating) subunit CbiE [Nitrospirales bacterium]
MSKVYVIGIGYKPLDRKAREALHASGVILASKRLFEVFRKYEEFGTVQEKVRVINSIEETLGFIRDSLDAPQPGSLSLLASGDPLFSGIGRRAVNEFGKDAVEILPELSSIQMAFARVKEPWDDAFLMSLHGGPDPVKRRRLPYTLREIPFLLQEHPLLAVLTDRENNPAEIAKAIAASPLTADRPPLMYICERLGYEEERVTEGMPDAVAGMSFSDPNVVIIKNTPVERKDGAPGEAAASSLLPVAPRLGLTEEEIRHSRGLITKDEVRAVTLHKLRLPLEGVFWDIGAGSGSVSVEAARLCRGLKVFAVEKNPEQLDNIRQNKVRFDVPNVGIVEGFAPDALRHLPAPDRVFIGGSSGRMEEILSIIAEKMPSGIVVINAATFETLEAARTALAKAGFAVEIAQVSVSRMRAIGEGSYLSALNPLFIIRGTTGGEG